MTDYTIHDNCLIIRENDCDRRLVLPFLPQSTLKTRIPTAGSHYCTNFHANDAYAKGDQDINHSFVAGIDLTNEKLNAYGADKFVTNDEIDWYSLNG